jgi:hypothetical protein
MGSIFGQFAALPLRFQTVVPLEAADVRIESSRSVKLRNLPDMAKVVASPLVQKLSYGDHPCFFMIAHARNGSGGHIA